MRNQRLGIKLAFSNELQRLLAVAAVNTAGLEGQILAIHIGEGKSLRLIVQRHHCYDCIGTRTLPCKFECALRAGNLQYDIRTAVIAVLTNEIKAIFRRDRQHIWIVLVHEFDAVLVLFANDNYREYIDRSELWADARQVAGRDNQFALSTEMLILAHIAHMAKHFVSGRFGIRPFLDLWLMKEKLHYDAEKLSQMLDSHHLSEFGKMAFGIVSVWFDQKAPTKTEMMAQDIILFGGVYGNLNNRISVTRSKQNFFCYFVQRIFLPPSSLAFAYPVLRKHPWQLPICWVRRWIRVIRNGRWKLIKTEYAINRGLEADKLHNIDDMRKSLNLKK